VTRARGRADRRVTHSARARARAPARAGRGADTSLLGRGATPTGSGTVHRSARLQCQTTHGFFLHELLYSISGPSERRVLCIHRLQLTAPK